MKYGIIIAVKDEAAAILADSFYRWKKKDAGLFESERGALLALSGVGKVFASHALSRIEPECERILVMGTSGGLGEQPIGSLFLCDEFCEHDMDVRGLGVAAGVTPFSAMKTSVIKNSSDAYISSVESAVLSCGLSVKKGRAISGDLFICDRETNDAKRDEFKADVVDMESAAIAKLCAFAVKKDVLALRYVSDNANHEASGHWKENVAASSIVFNSVLKKMLS